MAEPSSAIPISGQTGEPSPVPMRPNPTVVVGTQRAETGAYSRISSAYDDLRTSLNDTVARAGRNLRRIADEKPLHLLAGIALASLLAGAGLRIWRSHYE